MHTRAPAGACWPQLDTSLGQRTRLVTCQGKPWQAARPWRLGCRQGQTLPSFLAQGPEMTEGSALPAGRRPCQLTAEQA
eukprot:NODE_778_length_1788_cov_5.825187_g633_i0.p5 GENE.NODE_778_length_1788_cov_5.825187_g633_i0~~NODE_778_length_1788_cov_5.825187_g633_i0.p5  ORF type:complete len:79 (+),score=3.84 NODE_778_length_1788_cov_5.825187_g633_i0:1016-1252(+)